MVDNGNLAITFTSVFFLGLGLNLTPCVYPMLSITVSLFRGNGEPLHGHAFPKALAYVLGMVTMYSGLGLLAAYTGSFFGEFLQNFWVQLSVGILVTGLAFSMLGLYQFRLPSWLIPSGGWSSKHTCLSLYASGALVGIIAAPCMGPAVLALLTYVSTLQNAFLGFLLFFVMALGLGLPYLVLGTFSGLLKKLPKSGAWLVWFERVFGVVLLTFGAFYITIAFQWPVLKWIVPGALLGGGIYLGWWERSDRYSKMFVMIKRTLGTLAFFAGLFFVLMGPRQGIVWEPYRAGIFGEAQVSGQPVVLDFYADWCIPCHELDQFTYSKPKVIEALKNFRKIKVDTTSVETDEVRDVIGRFEVFGVPTVIFMDEKGREVPEIRMEGFVTAAEFLDVLRSSRLKRYLSPGKH